MSWIVKRYFLNVLRPDKLAANFHRCRAPSGSFMFSGSAGASRAAQAPSVPILSTGTPVQIQ